MFTCIACAPTEREREREYLISIRLAFFDAAQVVYGHVLFLASGSLGYDHKLPAGQVQEFYGMYIYLSLYGINWSACFFSVQLVALHYDFSYVLYF